MPELLLKTKLTIPPLRRDVVLHARLIEAMNEGLWQGHGFGRKLILVKGCLDAGWSEWFDEFKISSPRQNETLLKGALPDQPALYGIIARLRDLGLFLVEVKIEEEAGH
jgi:hypothetical protein